VGHGGLDAIQLQVGEQTVVMVNQREVHCDALLDGWIGKAIGHAVPVRRVGQLLATLGQIRLAVRLVDIG
jgi:hypothetical protein